MVLPRCFPEFSLDLALSENMTASEEIVLLDTASRAKAGAEEGSMRRMKKENMTTEVQSSLQRFGQSICIFRDGGVVGIVIGSDQRKVSEAMVEVEASNLTI